MNRRFRLTAVERLRTGALADAARALGQARRELTEALGHRAQIKAELQRTVANWRSSPAEQHTAATRRLQLREELALAGERCTSAHSQELAALAAWSAARADLRTVELLHERHRLLLAETDMRAEQREIDELAALSRCRTDDDPNTGGEDT